MEFFQILWYALMGVLLAGFFVCSGFDFGIGMLSIGFSDKRKRDNAMAEIAPFWDGNQVWLIVAGGALFAAFPLAYSLILANLYIPVILLLALLIFRVVAIEFFLALNGEKWRAFWIWVVALSSIGAMTLVGIALGALCGGEVLLKSDGGWTENFLRIFTPLAAGAAVLCVVFSLAHGSVYLAVKNSSSEDFRRLASRWLAALAVAYFAYLLLFFFNGKTAEIPRMFTLAVFVLAYMPVRFAMRSIKTGKLKTAFAMTSLFTVLAVCAHCMGAYPYIVFPSQTSPGVDIFSASSSLLTLKIMALVALIGVPLAIGYFAYSHAVFSKGGNPPDTGY